MRSGAARRLAILLGLGALASPTGRAQARESVARFPADAGHAPASQYAALSRSACLKELRRRGVSFTPVASAAGVLAPVRLRGKVGGVTYRTDLDPRAAGRTPWEVFDCRLVLALDDFSAILRSHDVEEVRIFSAWRPPPARWKPGKIARRHPGALALDVRLFKRRDGTGLEVIRDWAGQIGAETCGPDAVAPDPTTPEARELRSIVCQAADARIFHSILTPNYDRPHQNHLHLEVTADVKWFMVR